MPQKKAKTKKEMPKKDKQKWPAMSKPKKK
jgi:hypothetical protein